MAVVSSVAFAEEAAPIEISVSKEGAITLAGRPVAQGELAQHLTALGKKEKKPEVIITSAPEAPLKATTAVLDACRQSGYNKIKIQSR